LYGTSQFGGNDVLPSPGTSDEYYADGTAQSIRDSINDIYYAGYPPAYMSSSYYTRARRANPAFLYEDEIDPLEQLNVVPLNEADVGDFDLRSQYYNFNWRR
jgi:hypothetical protein